MLSIIFLDFTCYLFILTVYKEVFLFVLFCFVLFYHPVVVRNSLGFTETDLK